MSGFSPGQEVWHAVRGVGTVDVEYDGGYYVTVDFKGSSVLMHPHSLITRSSGLTASPLDTQIGGDHYRTGGIQPVQYAEANDLLFLEGCVVKRVTRHNRPTGKGRQDIEKAIHELQLLLALRYPE